MVTLVTRIRVVRRTTDERTAVGLELAELRARTAEDPDDLPGLRWATAAVVAPSRCRDEQGGAGDAAEVLRPFVHVPGDELGYPGALEAVEQADLATGRLVAVPLHVAEDVRGVVEGGESAWTPVVLWHNRT